MPYFDYSGKKIFYQFKDNKSRQAIIFIHGCGENSNEWKHQFELNIDYNIYALDLPSCNNSDEFAEHSLDLTVDVLRRFIKSLDLKNA
ncbi:MAG: alpha/beta fold hydrolase, partial [Promethearchaeota archaeon]